MGACPLAFDLPRSMNAVIVQPPPLSPLLDLEPGAAARGCQCIAFLKGFERASVTVFGKAATDLLLRFLLNMARIN